MLDTFSMITSTHLAVVLGLWAVGALVVMTAPRSKTQP